MKDDNGPSDDYGENVDDSDDGQEPETNRAMIQQDVVISPEDVSLVDKSEEVNESANVTKNRAIINSRDIDNREEIYKMDNNLRGPANSYKSRVTAVKAALDDDFDVIQAEMTESDQLDVSKRDY